MIAALLLACTPSEPVLEIHVMVEGPDVRIEWDSVTLRKSGQEWESDWEPMILSEPVQDIDGEYQLLATGGTEGADYIQFFADAAWIEADGESVADIIEPIAAPLQLDRGYRVDFELIVLEIHDELQIFAKDTSVYRN